MCQPPPLELCPRKTDATDVPTKAPSDAVMRKLAICFLCSCPHVDGTTLHATLFTPTQLPAALSCKNRLVCDVFLDKRREAESRLSLSICRQHSFEHKKNTLSGPTASRVLTTGIAPGDFPMHLVFLKTTADPTGLNCDNRHQTEHEHQDSKPSL